jgi:hypothetical protein
LNPVPGRPLLIGLRVIDGNFDIINVDIH